MARNGLISLILIGFVYASLFGDQGIHLLVHLVAQKKF